MKYSSSGVADEIGTTVKITHMYASMHSGKYLQNYIKNVFAVDFLPLQDFGIQSGCSRRRPIIPTLVFLKFPS